MVRERPALRDTQLPANVRHRRDALGVPQGVHDLLFRKSRLPHVLVSRKRTQEASLVQFQNGFGKRGDVIGPDQDQRQHTPVHGLPKRAVTL